MGESLIQVSWGRRLTLQSGTTFLRIKAVYLLPLTSHLAGDTGLHYIGSCACGTCWLCNLIIFLVLMFWCLCFCVVSGLHLNKLVKIGCLWINIDFKKCHIKIFLTVENAKKWYKSPIKAKCVKNCTLISSWAPFGPLRDEEQRMLRRNPAGNWVILIFSGENPCTRIIKEYYIFLRFSKGLKMCYL